MKTSLCEMCKHGLVKKYESHGGTAYNSYVCLLDYAHMDDVVVIECNSYGKAFKKVTYHDPEFSEYEKKVEGEH